MSADQVAITAVGGGADAFRRTVLRVDGLTVSFETEEGALQAVRGTSWEVREGETVVILGESGSGKSVSAHAIAGLLPSNAVLGGTVDFVGRDLLKMNRKEFRKVQAHDIGMIFQDPLSSLNPCYTVGDHIAEILRVHTGMRRRAAAARAVEMLDLVRIADPERRARQYPHEMSGGMRQRVMIAMAITLDPKLLIADEPTTALDTTVRGSVLATMQEMRDRLGMGVVLITHDIGVAAAVADRVVVMYGGRVVEYGPAAEVLLEPIHPYTAALLESMPRLERHDSNLRAIRGTPPSLRSMPPGCAFAPRCEFARDRCTLEVPAPLPVLSSSRVAACHFAEEIRKGEHRAE